MNRSANPEATLAVAALTVLIAVGLGMVGAGELAHLIGAGAPPPANPVLLIVRLAQGTYRWPVAATGAAVLEGLLVVTLATVVAIRIRRWNAGAEHIDRRARQLARHESGLRRYTDPAAAPVAREIGPGLQIGRVIR